MRRYVVQALMLMGTALLLLQGLGVSRERSVGFALGMGLFAANGFLLMFLGSRLFLGAAAGGGEGEGTGSFKRRPSLALVLSLFAKALGLAGVTFLVLVVFKVTAGAFVCGAGYGLTALVTPLVLERRRELWATAPAGSASAASRPG